MAQNDEQDGQEAAAGTSGDTAASSISPAEIQKLVEERDSLYDRLLRKQAEFDNFRKRIERERSEQAQFASADLMRELLNALDSFDLAIHSAAAETTSRENMQRGLDLVYKQFQDTLGRFGLKPIDAKGQPFDPNLHQAVTTVESAELDDNTVVEELRRGYTLNGRLLRAAMVTVAVHREGN